MLAQFVRGQLAYVRLADRDIGWQKEPGETAGQFEDSITADLAELFDDKRCDG